MASHDNESHRRTEAIEPRPSSHWIGRSVAACKRSEIEYAWLQVLISSNPFQSFVAINQANSSLIRNRLESIFDFHKKVCPGLFKNSPAKEFTTEPERTFTEFLSSISQELSGHINVYDLSVEETSIPVANSESFLGTVKEIKTSSDFLYIKLREGEGELKVPAYVFASKNTYSLIGIISVSGDQGAVFFKQGRNWWKLQRAVAVHLKVGFLDLPSAKAHDALIYEKNI